MPLTFTYEQRKYNIDESIIIPRYQHLINQKDNDYTVEFLYGGRDSGKSYSIAQILLIECMYVNKFRCALIREQSGDVKDSQWQLLKDIAEKWGVDHLFEFRKAPLEIECKMNGNKFIARGCNEPQNLKSITACNRAWIEEGVKERESMIVILGTIRSSESKVKVYYSFNPECEGDYHKWWLYEDWFEKHWNTNNTSFSAVKTMEILINGGKRIIKFPYRVTHSVYQDNPFCDDQRIAIHESNKGYYYTVYTKGLFGYKITGGEYLPSFKSDKHTGSYPILKELEYHISIDSNTAPYVSIIGCNILEDEKIIRQKWELPCRSPHTSATRAARKLHNYLVGLGYEGAIWLYGDATANNKSTVDVDNKSFFEKFVEELKSLGWIIVNLIGRSNPRVRLAGEFLNEILDELPSADGWRIEIDKQCSESIEDYTMCKLDMNGGIVKKIVSEKETGVKYQERGHLTDTLKYLVCKVLSGVFEGFGAKSKGYTGVGIGNKNLVRDRKRSLR